MNSRDVTLQGIAALVATPADPETTVLLLCKHGGVRRDGLTNT
jgi:hypothetical protein